MTYKVWVSIAETPSTAARASRIWASGANAAVSQSPGVSGERAGRRVSGGGAGGFLPQPEHKLGMLRVDPAIQFADSSLVTSPGVLRVKPGVLFDILVLSADDAGRQQQSGGEQLRAQLTSGPAPVALEVYDNGDGSYRVATASIVCSSQ